MMVPDELLEEVTRRFGFLADATRFKVLGELHRAGETAVGQPAEPSGAPLASVSQRLNRLASGGIVERVARGRA
jgi:DNA-binding transcriptional ArsR family regulator